MARLFEAALGNRLMTTILVVVFIALGLRAMVQLPIDAVPDVTPTSSRLSPTPRDLARLI